MADVAVLSVDVVREILILITFNQAVKTGDGLLEDPANYTVVPDDAGVPVIVRKVLVPSGAATTTVTLQVSFFTVGETYTVTVNNIRGADGSVVGVDNSAKFVGRTTKIDSALRSLPAMYDKRPESRIANLVRAIAQEDEIIGGSRDDDL